MGVLLMLLSAVGVIAAVILLAFSLAFKLKWLRNFVLGAVAVWFSIYFISLVGVSALSSDETLKPREAKAFCGFYLDCHLHAAVENVTLEPGVGEGPELDVRLRFFNDARRATLKFSEIRATLYFDDGTKVDSKPGDGRETRLPRGDSSYLDLHFPLAKKAGAARLFVGEGNAVDRFLETFLIGDEDSLFHGRTYFDIGSIDVPGTKQAGIYRK